MTEALRDTAIWRRLLWHHADVRHLHLRELLRDDPTRGERLAAEGGGISLDYSKHLVRDDTLELLRKLGAERGLPERARALLRGEAVSAAGRPGLHVALRMPAERSVVVDGADVVREARRERDRMEALAVGVRDGSRTGATGRPFRTVLTVGLGGSELPTRLAYEALRPFATDELTLLFVGSLDPAELTRVMRGLEPEETLVVFLAEDPGTPGWQAVARASADWLRGRVGEDVGVHLVCATSSADRAQELGIPCDQVFSVPSALPWPVALCSAAGLPTLVAIGPDCYRELLAGFHELDVHFATTALGANVPAISGLLAVWYRDFFGADARAIVPYSHALRLLPSYVGQLEATFLGSGLTEQREAVGVGTGQVVWGAVGTAGDDALLRLLHHGAIFVPADLVVLAQPLEGPADRHDLLAARAIGNAEALALGRTAEELDGDHVLELDIPRFVVPGNRPTSLVLARRLDPRTLGALLALYEHATFTQATIWGIDPFGRDDEDLGPELAGTVLRELAPGWKRELLHDPSTNAAITRYRHFRDDDA